MMLKKIGFMVLTAFFFVTMGGCNSQKDVIGTIEMNGIEMFPADNISKISSIVLIRDGNQIILQENGLEIMLKIGSKFIYQHGYVTDSISSAPVLSDNTIYIPSSFINDYLSGSNQNVYSLYHTAKFLPAEILSALKKPDDESNKKILSAIELPRSMNITIPKIDSNRVFQTIPLSKMPKELVEDLTSHGYTGASKYTYGEYLAISETYTLKEAGLTALKSTYPELGQMDISNWTVKDYNKWQSEYTKDQQKSMYTDEEKENMNKRGILIEDMFYLRKEFYGSALEQSDATIRKCLESYYQSALDSLLD